MLLLIFIFNIFAHEDLQSTTCTFEKESIVITKQQDDSYLIKTPAMKKAEKFKKPKVEDSFDKKYKQVFDTYTFSDKDLNLVVKRPETKGPIKNNMALWNNKKFNCK